MKNILKILAICALVIPTSITFTSCNNVVSTKFVDYAANLKFDKNSGRAYCEATVKQTVDGDTTHFYVPESVVKGGILKARYLGVDTPESTGKIEEYGKAASNFTKHALTGSANTKIILESNDSNWNVDSTGGRHLVFVWYQTPEMEDYKCLNVELMQNGLSKAKSGGSTVYGEVLQKALTQAMDQKINVYSGERDPLYYYGDYVETTIKGLREDPESYLNTLVRFDGLITKVDSNTAYVVDYDEDNELYYGMTVFYGYDASIGSNMEVGNLISFCGTYQFYETGGTYQVSGLTYMAMLPTYSKNLKVLQTGVEVKPVAITGTQFNDTTPKEVYGGISYMECILSSFVSMENLLVTDVYTTKQGDSTGAMTLTCTSDDGKEVQVRTSVLKKEDGTLLVKDDVINKTIDVKGIVGKYVGDRSTDYQINVFSLADLTIK